MGCGGCEALGLGLTTRLVEVLDWDFGVAEGLPSLKWEAGNQAKKSWGGLAGRLPAAACCYCDMTTQRCEAAPSWAGVHGNTSLSGGRHVAWVRSRCVWREEGPQTLRPLWPNKCGCCRQRLHDIVGWSFVLEFRAMC